MMPALICWEYSFTREMVVCSLPVYKQNRPSLLCSVRSLMIFGTVSAQLLRDTAGTTVERDNLWIIGMSSCCTVVTIQALFVCLEPAWNHSADRMEKDFNYQVEKTNKWWNSSFRPQDTKDHWRGSPLASCPGSNRKIRKSICSFLWRPILTFCKNAAYS